MTIEERVINLETKLNILETKLDNLTGKTELANQLIKFVILPLITILGGLIGIKLILPNG